MTIPPMPGTASCNNLPEARSYSITAESSKPFTIIASDSCSLSKTFTSFSLGSGRRSSVAFVSSAISSPVYRVGHRKHGPHSYFPDSNPSHDLRNTVWMSFPPPGLRRDFNPATQHLRAVCFSSHFEHKDGKGAQRPPRSPHQNLLKQCGAGTGQPEQCGTG